VHNRIIYTIDKFKRSVGILIFSAMAQYRGLSPGWKKLGSATVHPGIVLSIFFNIST